MAAVVALDTGPCVALFDRHDRFHESTAQFVRDRRPRFVTNVAVLTESLYLLNFHRGAQLDLLAWFSAAAVTLVHAESPDLSRASVLMSKYADLPIDFCDALLVAQCERLGIRQVATLDRDFEVYRLHGRIRFQSVLPAAAE